MEVGACTIDFYKANSENCFVAVRFDDREHALKCMEAYKEKQLFGYDVELSWYRDIRRYVNKRKEQEQRFRRRHFSRSPSRERRRSESGELNDSGQSAHKRRREDSGDEGDRHHYHRRSRHSISPVRDRRDGSDMEESDGEDQLVHSPEPQPVIGPKRIEVNLTSTPTKFKSPADEESQTPPKKWLERVDDSSYAKIDSNGDSAVRQLQQQQQHHDTKFLPFGFQREEPQPPAPCPPQIPITDKLPAVIVPASAVGVSDPYTIPDLKERVIGPYVDHTLKTLASPELALTFKSEIFKICHEYELKSLKLQMQHK